MSITQHALEQLAELLGYTVERDKAGSQYFKLLSPCDTFENMLYSRDRAFMHLLITAKYRFITADTIRQRLTWHPSITSLADGRRVYADASDDASVDAAISRVWRKPPPEEDDD